MVVTERTIAPEGIKKSPIKLILLLHLIDVFFHFMSPFSLNLTFVSLKFTLRPFFYSGFFLAFHVLVVWTVFMCCHCCCFCCFLKTIETFPYKNWLNYISKARLEGGISHSEVNKLKGSNCLMIENFSFFIFMWIAYFSWKKIKLVIYTLQFFLTFYMNSVSLCSFCLLGCFDDCFKPISVVMFTFQYSPIVSISLSQTWIGHALGGWYVFP